MYRKPIFVFEPPVVEFVGGVFVFTYPGPDVQLAMSPHIFLATRERNRSILEAYNDGRCEIVVLERKGKR